MDIGYLLLPYFATFVLFATWCFGWVLIFSPHRIIRFFLKFYDRLGIDTTNFPVDPHSDLTLSVYRIFGVALILVISLPVCIIFWAF